jgi:leucyl aminopeptidase (aminopeptidase T)
MSTLSAFDPAVHRAAAILMTDHMGVRAGETVLISADARTDPLLAPILMNAAAQAGARPMIATLMQLPLQGKLADPHLPDALRAAMTESDCWIDLTHPYIAGSQTHDHAVKAGRVRCLVAGGMDCGALSRLYGGVPLDALYELQQGLDELVAAATGKPCRLTDAQGTDVRFVLGKATGSKPRRALQAGATYSLPGSVVMYPDLESVQGTIVIVGAMHDWYGALERPLTLEVDGRIRRIVEDGPDVAILDRALRRAGGGDYGHVIHFSYGLHPSARYRGDCFVEDIRAVGANAIGFGRPWWEPGGGENHPDGLLLRQNLWIDGQQILKSGLVVAPEPMAAAAQRVAAASAPG